jgi:ABC-type nitrate/sulfonate/bicarbonate transport system substrate-binding protein
MKTKQRTIFKLVAFLLMLGLAACAEQRQEQEADIKKELQVTVGYLPMVSSLTHFVALDQGFYEAEGLQVEAQQTPTSNALAQDVVSGKIDAAIELAVVPLIVRLESAPGNALIFSTSIITAENGFDGVLVKPGSSINNLEDLSGMKVGVFPGTTAEATLKTLFEQLYPDLELPVSVQINPADQLQALADGDIDALFAYEPELTEGMVKYGFEEISTSLYALQYDESPIGVGAVNSDWARNNPDAAHRFYAAIDRAVFFIRQNPLQAAKILAAATGIDEDVAKKMHIMPMSLTSEIYLDNLEGYIDILFEMGEISSKPFAKDISIPQAQ